MTENQMLEVQRSLGRIEGGLQQLKEEMRDSNKRLREEFSTHKQDDQLAFSDLRIALKGFTDSGNARLAAQEERIDGVEKTCVELDGVRVRDEKRAEKVGKYVLVIISSTAAVIGGIVLSILKKYFNITIT